MKLKQHQKIYVKSMGKLLLATGIFKSYEDANTFMAKNKDHGVIAEYDGVIFTAHLYDHGIQA